MHVTQYIGYIENLMTHVLYIICQRKIGNPKKGEQILIERLTKCFLQWLSGKMFWVLYITLRCSCETYTLVNQSIYKALFYVILLDCYYLIACFIKYLNIMQYHLICYKSKAFTLMKLNLPMNSDMDMFMFYRVIMLHLDILSIWPRVKCMQITEFR